MNMSVLKQYFVCLFGWLVGFLTSSSTTRLYRGRVLRLTSDNFTVLPHTRERERGDHDFYLSLSHYTDTDPTSRNRTQDHLTRSCALYPLSYNVPLKTVPSFRILVKLIAMQGMRSNILTMLIYFLSLKFCSD